MPLYRTASGVYTVVTQTGETNTGAANTASADFGAKTAIAYSTVIDIKPDYKLFDGSNVQQYLDGDVDEIAGFVGSLSVTRPLDSKTDTIVDFDGDAAVARPLSSIMDSIFDFDGDFGRTRNIDSLSASIFDFDGDLTVTPSGGAVTLDGASSSIFDFDGDLSVTRPLNAIMAVVADVPTIQLGLMRNLDGFIAAISHQLDTIFVLNVGLNGHIDIISEERASFNTPRPLDGSIGIVFGTLSNLNIPGAVPEFDFMAVVLKMLMMEAANE